MHHTPTRDQFKHWTTIEVRWSEIDGYGHLNNVAYFSYFEAGRTRYILATCKDEALSGKSALQVMVNCTMNFRHEIRFPAIIDVGIAVSAIGTTSYTMQCGMFRTDTETLVADGTGKLVVVSPSTKRPMPVPEEYIRNFESLEERTIPRS
jgi:acyl-CoA thioester hydrolase